jgi:hypothetical protein
MVDHEKANKLWEQTYGNATQAKDRKGRLMEKGAYGQTGSRYGWNVHHKKPKSQGGTDAFDNLEIVHIKTHEELNNT